MASLKFASLNINGIQNKLENLTTFIKSNSIHVLAIQEAHVINRDAIQSWAISQNFLFYPNTLQAMNNSFKAGTAFILYPQLLHIQDIFSYNIINNRVQLLNFKYQNINKYQNLFNVYFPSGTSTKNLKYRTNCIQNLYDILIDRKQQDIYLLGDFNLVLSPLDRTGHFYPNSIDKILFQSILSTFNLTDVFRQTFPDKKTFSYIKSNTASRIDRIYIPTFTLNQIVSTCYTPVTFSDHCYSPSITIKPCTQPTHSSKTYWKLNDSLLQKTYNCQAIDTFISNFIENNNCFLAPIYQWETLKNKLKSYLKFISAKESKIIENTRKNIHKNLQQAINQNNTTEIWEKNQKLIQLEKLKLRGAQIRSRDFSSHLMKNQQHYTKQ